MTKELFSFKYAYGDWVRGTDPVNELYDFHGEIVQRYPGVTGFPTRYHVQDRGGTRHVFWESQLNPAETPPEPHTEEEE